MADKKYQIFISSTYRDLIDHRRDIARSVLDLGHVPAAMEYFPAMDEDQLQYIKRVIDQCDYYIIVIAGKYGSIDKSQISYTEREYDYAKEKGKFILGFPMADIRKLPREQTEEDTETIKKLEKFRKKIMSSRLVRTWEDVQDLDLKVTKALANAFSEFPQDGWVRSPKSSNEELLQELNDLRKENNRLVSELDLLQTKNRPIIDDLVDIETKYSIIIFIKSTEPEAETKTNLSMKWIDIFIDFGYCLSTSKTRQSLCDIVVKQLAYRYKNSKNLIIDYDSCAISEDDFETILMQLTAYGIIEKNRGLYRLTDAGENLYMNSRVVKSNKPKDL